MIGRQVKHRTFGTGTIVAHESGKISVDFSGVIRHFQFPESFERFLSTEDADLRQMVTAAFKEKTEARQKAEEARRIAKVEEEAATLRTAKAASNIPFPPYPKKQPIARQQQGENVSVAFKCNFCDGGASGTCIGFNGKCSDSMIWYNIEKAKHVRCSTNSVCRSYYDGHISRAELNACANPCQESNLHNFWTMTAGYHQRGERIGKPLHMNQLHSGSLAVLTTRKPSDKESDRFIFAAFLVDDAYGGDEQETGTVSADPAWRIELAPGQAERILFWNYYYNARKPEKIAYGSGLYRYLTDIEAAQILRDIASVKGDGFSAAFFMHFCEVNGIDTKSLAPASGALIRGMGG